MCLDDALHAHDLPRPFAIADAVCLADDTAASNGEPAAKKAKADDTADAPIPGLSKEQAAHLPRLATLKAEIRSIDGDAEMARCLRRYAEFRAQLSELRVGSREVQQRGVQSALRRANRPPT